MTDETTEIAPDPWFLGLRDTSPSISYDARSDVLYVSLHTPRRAAIYTEVSVTVLMRFTSEGDLTGMTIDGFARQALQSEQPA